MVDASAERTLSWDWYPGRIPDNAILGESAYIETTYSFTLFRSTDPAGLRFGKAASSYLGTMFDVGPQGRVTVGDYTLLHGVRFICEKSIAVGSYTLISWNVVLMDSYRLPFDAAGRREILRHVPEADGRTIANASDARPISIGDNVWIGFDCCILPGVSIGDGAIIGARSVVTADVEPYTIVAGNPARFIRTINADIPRAE